jgi:8-oxo-dGTP pyrophosphatase MutT (NUDIX family)
MAHLHEKIDFTVTVYVVYNGKVLLRLHEKYHEWFGVGGHIELDEDANTAAIRETKEEIGLDIQLIPPPQWVKGPGHSSGRELIPPLFLNIHHVTPTHQHHDLIFAATSATDAVIPEHQDDQWLWLSAEALTAHPDINAHVKHYAASAISVTGSSPP